jgi:hypothetical protein
MGTWMDQVTRGWLIYELTDSALQLGLVRGIQAVPFLLLSPVAGSAADRGAAGNPLGRSVGRGLDGRAAGSLAMIVIYVALPRARHIR